MKSRLRKSEEQVSKRCSSMAHVQAPSLILLSFGVQHESYETFSSTVAVVMTFDHSNRNPN